MRLQEKELRNDIDEGIEYKKYLGNFIKIFS
jgi:hypothetical protein